MAASEFETLKQVFYQLARQTSANGKDIVATTALRVVAREANDVFNQIQAVYPGAASPIDRVGASKTKVLLIKPVGDHCNLRCSYCYETLRLAKSKEKIMKIPQIAHYLKTFVGKDSGITDLFLHGGEPLLAGKEFFHAFIAVLKEMGLYGRLTLGVQTNGTLLDKEWVTLLKEHNFRVGISLDGDEEINDRYRVDHKGRGTYRQVIRGMDLLREQDVPFGVICVVSAETAAIPGVAKRILDHFVALDLAFIDIHPAFTPEDTSGTAAKDNLSAELYCRFMTELAEAWAACNHPELRLRCIEDIFENLSHLKTATCYAAGLCTHILGMDPSGNVSPCTRPFQSKYNFGNAGFSSLAELEQAAAFRQFEADEQAGRLKTQTCQWAPLCGSGGCPHERFTDGRQDPAGRHIFCTCTSEHAANVGFPGFYRNLTRMLKNHLSNMQESYLAPLAHCETN